MGIFWHGSATTTSQSNLARDFRGQLIWDPKGCQTMSTRLHSRNEVGTERSSPRRQKCCDDLPHMIRCVLVLGEIGEMAASLLSIRKHFVGRHRNLRSQFLLIRCRCCVRVESVLNPLENRVMAVSSLSRRSGWRRRIVRF